MKKIICLVLCIMLVASTNVFAGANGSIENLKGLKKDDVITTVNGLNITFNELMSRVEIRKKLGMKSDYEYVYNYIVEQKIILSEVLKREIFPNEDIENHIKENKKEYEQNKKARDIVDDYIKRTGIPKDYYWEISVRDGYTEILVRGTLYHDLLKENEQLKSSGNYSKNGNQYYFEKLKQLKETAVIENNKSNLLKYDAYGSYIYKNESLDEIIKNIESSSSSILAIDVTEERNSVEHHSYEETMEYRPIMITDVGMLVIDMDHDITIRFNLYSWGSYTQITKTDYSIGRQTMYGPEIEDFVEMRVDSAEAYNVNTGNAYSFGLSPGHYHEYLFPSNYYFSSYCNFAETYPLGTYKLRIAGGLEMTSYVFSFYPDYGGSLFVTPSFSY